MFSDDLIQNHLRVLDCVNFEINTTSLIEKRDYKKRENMELYEKNLTDGCYYERFKKFVREIMDTEG